VTPDAIVDRVEDIDPSMLSAWEIRGAILDLDNTLVPWNTADVSAPVKSWVAALKSARIGLCVLTNNYTRRASSVAELLEIPIIKGAFKPSPIAFRGALRMLGVDAGHAVVVGDQLYTDVLGGKLLGMRAVLVTPLSTAEFPTTRIVRWLERPVREMIRRTAGRPRP
jgi:HAD superfamily phosphatase (TIGR01668 family)